MKYTIEITETLQRQVEIEAETPEDAEKQARELYKCFDVELTAECLKETTFVTVYDLYGDKYTIEQLRQGYREITALDNDDEFNDKEIYEYMLEVFQEG